MLYLYYASCVALSERVPASAWCPVALEFTSVWYVLCICTVVYMYELVHTWLEACWCYVTDWLLVLLYPNAG